MAQHEGFGKGLAAFQLGRLFCGADDVEIPEGRVFYQEIGNAFHQRLFGAHQHQAYLFANAGIAYG